MNKNLIEVGVTYVCTADAQKQATCKHYESRKDHEWCMFRQSAQCLAPWAQREAFGAFVVRQMSGEVLG